MSLRTYRRWTRDGKIQADRRSEAHRTVPQNKLSEQERQAILDAANEPSYANLHPSQIVPTLLDEGVYLGSESSFYRILKEHEQLNHRGRSQSPKNSISLLIIPHAGLTRCGHGTSRLWLRR
jgi:putative transposase